MKTKDVKENMPSLEEWRKEADEFLGKDLDFYKHDIIGYMREWLKEKLK